MQALSVQVGLGRWKNFHQRMTHSAVPKQGVHAMPVHIVQRIGANLLQYVLVNQALWLIHVLG
jgi:hypothetical protein